MMEYDEQAELDRVREETMKSQEYLNASYEQQRALLAARLAEREDRRNEIAV